MLVKLLPLLFALLWSTGFVGAKFGLPYIDPFTFLAIRLLIAIIVLYILIRVLKLKLPKLQYKYLHIIGSGLMIHLAYLGGVFTAIKIGLPVGDTAIIIGMQPILTTLFMHRTSLGKVLLTSFIGFLGLLCVIHNGNSHLIDFQWSMLLPAIIALFGMTLGTIYQKSKCAEFHIITIAFIQYIPVFFIFCGLSYFFESPHVITWNKYLLFAILWLSLILSVGTILLMSYLYRAHSATKAANFFYLAPPLALIQGHLFFDEPITIINCIGIILVVGSLYFTNRLLSK